MSAMKQKGEMRLVGENGNAFAILGRFRRTALAAGWSPEEVKAVLGETTSGDYDHLLATVLEHVEDMGGGAGSARRVSAAFVARPHTSTMPWCGFTSIMSGVRWRSNSWATFGPACWFALCGELTRWPRHRLIREELAISGGNI